MRTLLDAFEAGFNRLNRFIAGLVAVSICLFAILIPLNLFLLRVQWGSMWWLYEAVEYTLYFGVFLGAPWVLQQGAHVKVDVFMSSLPERGAERLDLFLNIFGVVLCGVLFSYGARSAIGEFAEGILPDKDLRIPTGYMMVVFSFSFLLLAVEFLLRMRKQRALAGREAGAVPETGL